MQEKPLESVPDATRLSDEEFQTLKQAGKEKFPDDEFIFSRWSVAVSGYPQVGQRRSWTELVVWTWWSCGAVLKLSGHFEARRPDRSPKLIVKGPQARRVYDHVFQETKKMIGAPGMLKCVPQPRLADCNESGGDSVPLFAGGSASSQTAGGDDGDCSSDSEAEEKLTGAQVVQEEGEEAAAKFSARNALHDLESSICAANTANSLEVLQEVAGHCARSGLPEQALASVAWSMRAQHIHLELPFTIYFCSTRFGRLCQLRRALPVNLLLLWPSRSCVTVVLTLFQADPEVHSTMSWLRQICGVALQHGSFCIAMVRAEACKYYDSPAAKNTACRAAIDLHPATPLSQKFLVNLDADNIMCPEFLQAVRAETDAKKLITVLGADAGVSGRNVVSAEMWLHVGGYNQMLRGMGYQDIDFYARVVMPGAQHKK